MRQILFLIIIFSSSIYSQIDSAKEYKIIPSIDIFYNQKYLTTSNPYIKTNINYVGVGVTDEFVVSHIYHVTGNLSYMQIIPQTIKVNNTTNVSLTGFNVSIPLFGKDFIKNKNIDLIFCLGVNTGRIRTFGNSEYLQKNPYFSPKISIMPRISFYRLCVFGIIDYGYDISDKSWKKTLNSSRQTIYLNKLDMTGLNVTVGIGYNFFNKNPPLTRDLHKKTLDF